MRVALRVLGESVTVEAQEPAGPVRLDEPLPFLRALEDQVIGVAVRQAEAAGAKISCCKGCAACCKAQPVPVTPPEAYALWRLVGSLPALRQREIRARFGDRVSRLRAAGLEGPLLRRDATASMEEARAVAQRYFQLGLVCPFLEDDSCSIYAERPFVCRQYLVTSPASLCQDPFHNPIARLALPIAAAGATLAIAEKTLGAAQFTVPLVLALDYAESHRAELEQTFAAPGLYRDWVQAMTAGDDARDGQS
ncbi:MAG: YkgJ family cysteine cluster protein [Gemmataceae bacterium]|nr:YkgJ family cysteine cluster protein [Gemmataceae bacterium]MCI0738834.1 YkgJ family cysteine cluster protein [Gemmataceae bacterium]